MKKFLLPLILISSPALADAMYFAQLGVDGIVQEVVVVNSQDVSGDEGKGVEELLAHFPQSQPLVVDSPERSTHWHLGVAQQPRLVQVGQAAAAAAQPRQTIFQDILEELVVQVSSSFHMQTHTQTQQQLAHTFMLILVEIAYLHSLLQVRLHLTNN